MLARDATEEEDNDLGCPLPALDQPSVLDLLETVLRVVDPDDQVACTWLCSSSSFTCPVGNTARSGRPELMREAEYKGVFVGLVYIKAANVCQEQTSTYSGLQQILLQYVVYSMKVSWECMEGEAVDNHAGGCWSPGDLESLLIARNGRGQVNTPYLWGSEAACVIGRRVGAPGPVRRRASIKNCKKSTQLGHSSSRWLNTAWG